MEIILLDNIDKLGKLGDLCTVRAGYARNYLFPQGLALPATAENRKVYEAKRAELTQQIEARMELTAQQAQKAAGLSLRFHRRASEEGKLYGSVTLEDVVTELLNRDIQVAKRQINMPDGTLRHTGEYSVQLRFDAEHVVDVPLEVVAQTQE